MYIFCSDEEEEKSKKEVVLFVFKNKKEAMDVFKSLLKEKVCLLLLLKKFIFGYFLVF